MADFDPSFNPEDSLVREMAFLEALLSHRPAVAPIVMNRLGAIGQEARVDLVRLLNERSAKIDRARLEAKRAQRQRAASVAAMIATAPSIVVAAPAVAEEAAPVQVVLRVMDGVSGKPLSDVRIMTVAEHVVAVTDQHGRASIPSPYTAEPILTLDRQGYPLVLVEGQKLSNRSLVTMKPFTNPTLLADLPPSISAVPRPGTPQLAVPITQTAVVKPAAPKPPVAEAPAAKPAPAAAPVVAQAPAEKPVAKAAAPEKPAAKPAAVAQAPVAETVTGPAPKLAAPQAEPKPEAQVAVAEDAAKAPVMATKTALAAKPAPVAAPKTQAPIPVARVVMPEAKTEPKPEAPAAEAPKPVMVAINKRPAAKKPEPAPLLVAEVAPEAAAPKAEPQAEVPAQPSQTDLTAAAAAHPVTPPVKAAEPPAAPQPKAVHPVEPPAKREPWVIATGAATAPKPEAVKPAAPAAAAEAPKPEAPKPRVKRSNDTTTVAKVKRNGKTVYYKVKAGDSLSLIALRELGDMHKWPQLFFANRDQLTNPRWLPIGITLKVPGDEPMVAGKTYTVKPGDSLSKIAKSQLGDIRAWPTIYAANRHTISDPRWIFPGQQLVLPGQAAEAPISWASLVASHQPPGEAEVRSQVAPLEEQWTLFIPKD